MLLITSPYWTLRDEVLGEAIVYTMAFVTKLLIEIEPFVSALAMAGIATMRTGRSMLCDSMFKVET